MFDIDFIFPLTGLVQMIIVVMIFAFALRVGINRDKMGVPAPAMTGNEEWERYCRVHLNSVEQAILFIPMMWLTAFTAGDTMAASAGAVWVVGRILFSQLYIKDPKSRGPGILLTLLALVGTLVMAGMEIIPALF